MKYFSRNDLKLHTYVGPYPQYPEVEQQAANSFVMINICMDADRAFENVYSPPLEQGWVAEQV